MNTLPLEPMEEVVLSPIYLDGDEFPQWGATKLHFPTWAAAYAFVAQQRGKVADFTPESDDLWQQYWDSDENLYHASVQPQESVWMLFELDPDGFGPTVAERFHTVHRTKAGAVAARQALIDAEDPEYQEIVASNLVITPVCLQP